MSAYISQTLHYALCIAPYAPNDAVRVKTRDGTELVYCRLVKWESTDGKSGGVRYVPMTLTDLPILDEETK